MTPEDVLQAGVQEGVYPGAQLAIALGPRRLSVAAGTIGPELGPAHPDTIYDLASLTKPLATSILLGRALEAGQCNLTDAISKFVPEADPTVRLHHLLDHSAGYPAHRRFDEGLPSTLRLGGWDAYRHIVLDAARTPREAEPGTRAVYSDIGFILLGAALEEMSGEPLSTLFAGLNSRLFFEDRRLSEPVQNDERAPTEAGLRGLIHDENCRAMGGTAGHAGLWGTAHGVVELCVSLVRAYRGAAGEVLTPATVRQLWAPSPVPGSSRTLGWDRPTPGKSSTGQFWPAHSVGHLGFTGTSVWIEPQRGLVVALITNRVCPTRDNVRIRTLRPRLHDAVWRAWIRPGPAE